MSASKFPPEVAVLIESGDGPAIAALQTLTHDPDKRIAKAARAALFSLSQRGIAVPTAAEPAQGLAPVAISLPADEPLTLTHAILSLLTEEGTRALLLRSERPGGVVVHDLELHWRTGIVEANASEYQPEAMQPAAFIRDTEETGAPSSVIPLDQAARCLHAAAARSKRRGRILPMGTAAAIATVGDPPAAPPAVPVAPRVAPTEVELQYADLLLSWCDPDIDTDHFDAVAAEYDAAAPSLLLLPRQVEKRRVEALARAADRLFDERSRLDWIDRIEDDASVFDKIDQEGADIAVSMRRLLESCRAAPTAGDDPVLRAIVEILLSGEDPEDEEEDDDGAGGAGGPRLVLP